MPFFERSHGANPEKLYAAMGLPLPEKIIDFSTNTNALPWPSWYESWSESWDLRRCLASYPDDEATALRSEIAQRESRHIEGCSVRNVLAVNGSNEAVYLIASFFGGRKTVLWQPVYGEYLRALSAYGADVSGVFSPDDLPRDAEAFFLCNPCNPTGGYIEGSVLEKLILRHSRTLFVVDEAYVDFLIGSPTHAPIDFLRHRNVVVLRSLTKIFHLCGARIGYVLACEERIAQLGTRRPTWSVNSVAQAAALAFMKDGAFVRETRSFYAEETPRFVAATERAGFKVLPTRTHFFLVEVADDQKVMEALLKRGLVVRHTRNFPGLDGRYIRVSTRMPEENDLLVRALQETPNGRQEAFLR
ncbi:MAG: pyridoxal phosphate-dependent class II aminotransferase [Synergistaceae bacterium]|jgi:threonine-phosphate decarboxylase|nr:pyridoxal phosphate-dependent class II aminotransferase [Synergistaceae bacterium]